MDSEMKLNPSVLTEIKTDHSAYEDLKNANNAAAAQMSISNIVDTVVDCVDKPVFKEWCQKVAAEMIGTFFIVFAGCGAAMVDYQSHGAVTHVGISLTFGLVVTAVVYSIGHISGAHCNPAVTIAFATVKEFPWKYAPVYIVAQVLAAIASAFALRFIIDDVANIGATIPAGSDLQSLAIETIVTFILMFVVMAVATDPRAVGELGGLTIGSTIALNALFGGPISGASMNPARSFGPAVAANNYDAIWVYILGPIVGAVAGAVTYKVIQIPQQKTL
ncbi:hypothetical protein O6H91_06G108100 [Diphasiastrum complanatum]|uniref:Uncharacterized protein n=1 Tax=Diphasiastrum complanatum TaxID=34168 RepID=A0ACC2DHN8_DIPCM|nr:hypothetical protein O6H91_06G108100 [Diphasiastrum complanatum]